ncbi:MAG: methyltransferase domain-containing protein [Anaerolineaceae bacterium]|nr:methyltransferase domain-containing protein [Anaerolineaceae bacterium]
MSPPRRRAAPARPQQLCEAEVVAGLKEQAASELRTRFGSDVRLLRKARTDELPFHFHGELAALGAIGKSNVINVVQHFDIPRPAAFLGHQHLTRLLRQIDVVRSLQESGSFRSFRISAAGRDSAVMQRLKEAIARQTGLVYDDREGDLLLRIRKADLHRNGWELLTRLTPRPLSARAWRVCNLPGALNATIAAAMVEMTHPQPDDRFFNLMCGSGTLLVERLLRAPLLAAAGCDTDPHALRCAADNLRASGAAEQAQLFPMDATQLQLPDAGIDVLCADLPWGQLLGSHENNLTLYPLVLAEAARVAAPGARAVFITHEIRLMERVLRDCADRWTIQREVRVFQGGLHPRIYLLARRD